MKVVIVTGLSGAGKSQAVKVLEDMDFFCVDNLPPVLLAKFLEMCKMSEDKFEKVAIVMDIRAGKYQKTDGTYRKEFFEMVNTFEKRLEYAKNNTSLPDHPDMNKVQEFVMAVNRRAIDVED